MDRISISQLSTRNWWLEEDAIRYASFGFQSIAVWRDKLSDYSIDFVSTLLSDLNLSVSSLRWGGGFTGSDGKSFSDAIDDSIDAIRQASRLGTEYLVIHPGDRRFHTRTHSERLLRTALTELIPVADDFGVRLLIQPMPCSLGKTWTFVNDFQSAVDFCQEFSGKPGLILNLFQWADRFDSIVSRPDWMGHVRLVQMSDRQVEQEPQCSMLGCGDLPLQSWIKRLNQVDYQGMFEIELFGPGVESVTYANRLQHTSSYLNQLSKSISLARSSI